MIQPVVLERIFHNGDGQVLSLGTVVELEGFDGSMDDIELKVRCPSAQALEALIY